MEISCPQCDTGFNLPDKHITTKGAKLRCSKCGHVFRVRRVDDSDEPEIFYKEEDHLANGTSSAKAEPDPVPSRAGHATQFGLGNLGQLLPEEEDPATLDLDNMLRADDNLLRADEASSTQLGKPAGLSFGLGLEASSSAVEAVEPARAPAPSLDPFPMAGQGLGMLKKKLRDRVAAQQVEPSFEDLPEIDIAAPLVEGRTVAGESFSPDTNIIHRDQLAKIDRAIDTSGLDLFDDPPEAPGDDLFGGAFDEQEAPASDDLFGSAVSAPADEVPILQPSAPLASGGQHHTLLDFGGQPTEPPPSLNRAPAREWGQQPSPFGDADDLVDPSFGAQGEQFDARQGAIVNAASGAVAQAPPARPSPRAEALAAAASPVALPVATPAAPAASATPAAAQWDERLEPQLAPHQIGGSGLQKVANLVLILCLVCIGFVGLVATLSGGVVDFARFGHMLEVAFGDEPFSPREAWLPAAAPVAAVAPVKQEPLRVESVSAQVVKVGKRGKALVLRGKVRNTSARDYVDVRLRGLIVNDLERIIGEAEVDLTDQLLTDKALSEAGTVADAQALIAQAPVKLKANTAASFTLIFKTIPEAVEQGEAVLYRTEFVKQVSEAELAAP